MLSSIISLIFHSIEDDKNFINVIKGKMNEDNLA